MEHITIKDWPAEEKPRERLLRQGVGALSNTEILAILIGTGSRGKTAIQVAQRLLSLGNESYDSGLEFLQKGSAEEILAVPGMGPAKVARIKAALELGRRLQALPTDKQFVVRQGQDVYDLLKTEVELLEREHFMVIMLGSRNQLIGREIVSIGTLDSSIVHPREVFKNPIKKNAASVVVVHNHPSGDPTPSDDDVRVTKRLIDAGVLLGIHVLDHVIIGRDKYVSLRETYPRYFR